MNATRPPKRPDGRAAIEGARRAFEGPNPAIPVPDDGLGEAMVRRVYGDRDRHEDIGVSLSEEDDLVRFTTDFQGWFRSLTPARRAAVIRLADREIERETWAILRKRTYQAAIGLATGAAAIAHFGADNIPIIKQIWQAIRGTPS